MSVLGYLARIVIVVVAWLKYRLYSSIKQYTSFETAEYIPDRKKRLKILQYNVSWPTSGKPSVKARIQEFSERVSDYDVLLLSGAYQGTNGLLKLFLEIAEARGFKYYVSGPVPTLCSLAHQDSGSFILSRFPITWSDAVAFKTSGAVTLGAAYARVRVSAFENAHFVVADLSASPAARQTELGVLSALIRKHVTDRFPVFVGGSLAFDAARDPAAYAEITRALAVPKREVVDIAFDAEHARPVTYGDEGEVVLTPQADRGSKKSADYLLYLRPPQDWVIETITTTIESFPTAGKFYRQLSSHAAISATLDLRDPD
jgi:endonuclease/exonuclease/phosphatase family metal-dependent hydrolase